MQNTKIIIDNQISFIQTGYKFMFFFKPWLIGDVVETRKQFPFGLVHLDICKPSTLMWKETTEPWSPRRVLTRSWLDSILTPERFVCHENTTDPVTGTNTLDMFCLASVIKRLLVSMDKMVYLSMVTVWLWLPSPFLSFVWLYKPPCFCV